MNQIEKALADYLGEVCGMQLRPHALTGLAQAAIAAMQPAPQWQRIESDTTVERCFLWCTDKVTTDIVAGSVRNGKARSNVLIGDWTFTHWIPHPTPPAGGSDAE